MIGSFGDKSFKDIDCIGADNQNQLNKKTT